MRYEDTGGSLRALCDRLFAVVEDLSGERPQPDKDYVWYRAQVNGKAFVYLRVIGKRARTFPPNSVHLAAEWDDSLMTRSVVQGNNWWGYPSADLTAEAAKPHELDPAEEFIRAAFRLKQSKL